MKLLIVCVPVLHFTGSKGLNSVLSLSFFHVHPHSLWCRRHLLSNPVHQTLPLMERKRLPWSVIPSIDLSWVFFVPGCSLTYYGEVCEEEKFLLSCISGIIFQEASPDILHHMELTSLTLWVCVIQMCSLYKSLGNALKPETARATARTKFMLCCHNNKQWFEMQIFHLYSLVVIESCGKWGICCTEIVPIRITMW